MSVKVKILSENKKKKIDESVLDMLADPAMLAVGAGGLMMLYQALFGKKPDPQADLERVKREIEEKIAKADAGRAEYRARRDANQAANQARLKAKLDDLKKQRAMELPPPEEMSNATKLPPPEEMSNVSMGSGSDIEDRIVKRYARTKKLADDPRTPKGEAVNAQKKVSQMRRKYPGIDNHPDVRLYETFRRFL
tara:strand:+ start:1137 stop:1718 length:582 start_codon:yes stop_codon:yes gene_type:complete